MSGRQLNLAMVIKADAKGVAPATSEARQEVQSVGAAGRDAARDLDLLSAANAEVAASSRRAIEAMRGQSAAERDLRASVNAFAGVRAPMNDNGYEKRRADIAAFGQELDNLRARFVPAAAAEQSLLAVQRDINDAFRVGAITAEEQADALERARLAHDRTAAAAAAQAEQYRLLAAAGREAYAEDLAQRNFNSFMGIGGQSSSASSSFGVFEEAGMLEAANQNAQNLAKSTALATHEMTNLTYQTNDMVTMLLVGQEPLMMLLQQGPQVAQIMGQRGLGEILPALGQATMNLVTPTTMFLAGITAAGYAGYAAFRMMKPEIIDADEALQRHNETIEELARGYGLVAEKIKAISFETSALIGLRVSRSEAEMRLVGAQEAERLLSPSNWRGLNPLGAYQNFIQTGVDDSLRSLVSEFTVDPKFDAFAKPILEFVDALQNGGGLDAVTKFRSEVADIWAREPNNKALRDNAAALLDATEAMRDHAAATDDARRAREAFERNVDAAGRVRAGDWAKDDMAALQAFQTEQARAIRQAQEAFEAEMLQMRARSPDERAAAARAREAARRDDNESAPERRNRIELEGRRALAEAEYQLAEASRERARSLDETLNLARLDVELVGRNAAEVDRLRMEHQLLAELRREAAQNGVEASEQEIAAIRAVAAETSRLRAIAGARDFIRTQQEELEMVRVQMALVGSSEQYRARMIAALEAERTIRERGIDVMGREAQQIRDGAQALASATLELNRQAEAWGNVQRAGESVIDNVLDRLVDGDWTGALKSMSDEFLKLSLQMGAANPLKNAIFGTNYGTFQDVGGWGGILGRLFGGGDAMAQTALGGLGASYGAMTVSAGTVIVNGALGAGGGAGGGILGNITRLLTGANDNTGDVQSTVWSFFANKGLQPHQIAGIMGNVSAESSFNPLAIGDAGSAFGLFQHNDRAPNLFSFLGGKDNLSNVQGQLEFAWKELMTTERRALDALLSSRNVGEATAAFGGFERPQGFSWQNPEAMHNWTGRLRDAERAMERFGGVAMQATGNLDMLGGGMAQMGQNLSNYFPPAPAGGGGGGFLSGLGSLFGFGGGGSHLSPAAWNVVASGGMTGLFKSGDYTGDGDPSEVAGLAHKGEFYFSAEATRTLGVPFLRGLHNAAKSGRGFREGGYADPWSAGGTGFSGTGGGRMPSIRIEVVDRAGVSIEAGEARQDASGDLMIPMLIADIEGRMVSSMQGGALGKATAQTFGLGRVTR